MKIKVLHILNRLIIGGPTIVALNIINNLPDNFEVKLLVGEKDESEKSGHNILESMPANIVYISTMRRSLNLINDIRAYRAIKKIIKEYKPDIIHTHASKAGAIGRLAASHVGVPVIIHTFHGHIFHSYFNKLITRAFIQTEKYLAKKSTKIIAISHSQKEELAHTFNICNSEKITVIPNGINLEKFNENKIQKRTTFRNAINVINNETILIGIVGRMVPVKNYAMFVDVIELFLKKSSAKNIQFVIIGDGQTRKEIQLKLANQQIKYNYFPENKNATDSTVIFTSWQAEMDMVFAGLDIVCLTSLNEGTPTSLIEAQAASLPIVSTNVGGVADTVIENQTAFLTAPNDVNDFVEKLEILVNSATIRKEMGEKGFVFVNEKYNHKRFINDTVNLYQDLYINNKG